MIDRRNGRERKRARAKGTKRVSIIKDPVTVGYNLQVILLKRARKIA